MSSTASMSEKSMAVLQPRPILAGARKEGTVSNNTGR